MPKERKSLGDLRDMVEGELRKYPDFNEVTLLNAYWHERDEDGCNWDVSHWNGPKELVSATFTEIKPAVLKMRLKFDAPDPNEALSR